MILYLHCQAFVGGIERRAFGYGPGLQHALHLQAEIVVQPSCAVLLHHKAMPRLFLQLGWWLGSFLETALALVLVQGHETILALRE